LSTTVLTQLAVNDNGAFACACPPRARSTAGQEPYGQLGNNTPQHSVAVAVSSRGVSGNGDRISRRQPYVRGRQHRRGVLLGRGYNGQLANNTTTKAASRWR